VFYSCPPRDGCGNDWMTGRISQSSVEHQDEVWIRAESMVPE